LLAVNISGNLSIYFSLKRTRKKWTSLYPTLLLRIIFSTIMCTVILICLADMIIDVVAIICAELKKQQNSIMIKNAIPSQPQIEIHYFITRDLTKCWL
jgi:hypothetical protein